ncbi:hypothetical protein KW850_26995 [Bacillus sp. sid0103]|uniref:hypothetical protein n=1 Tax=Bacillus sp. sid0103 TaxID=2856337 RepID=UPI001C48ABC6|nr:hypothetical protein [Bacillus sp. sid0103]MBV7508855.1 hypothetical protein [Bacillus sp. sid0103]
MSFEKLPTIEGGSGGCACCGYQYSHLPLQSLIAVGFGHAAVTKNGEEVYTKWMQNLKMKIYGQRKTQKT